MDGLPSRRRVDRSRRLPVLAVFGLSSGQLRATIATTVVLLWLAGFVGLRYLTNGTLFFAPYVAILDVGLVFAVFKGDVRLH